MVVPTIPVPRPSGSGSHWKGCRLPAQAPQAPVRCPRLVLVHRVGCDLFVCVIHISSADPIRERKKAGWRLARVNGSHHVFTHPQLTGIVVVPRPKNDWGKGLVKARRLQAGI
jgi:predicted RNA binding protein YcfA (HicA-like mRNA interferase family)